MVHIRPFRNEDPPRLLSLWKKCQRRNPPLVSLSMNALQMQVLGMPFWDRRAIMLAFEREKAVGYVHTTLGPSSDGSRLDSSTGQICFLCVDPAHTDRWAVANALLQAAERYLTNCGAKTIYGGSPRFCAPFYFGFHGGGEPIGFFDSDQYLIQTFLSAGYLPCKRTVRFRLDSSQYVPKTTPSMLGWAPRLVIEHDLYPNPRTWWEAMAQAGFHWSESVAYLTSSRRPVARATLRIVHPDFEQDDNLYGKNWDAGLVYVGVHPDFQHQGIAAYLLEETVRHLMLQGQIADIEAQVTDDSPFVQTLLRSLNWKEIDTGTLYQKEI